MFEVSVQETEHSFRKADAEVFDGVDFMSSRTNMTPGAASPGVGFLCRRNHINYPRAKDP